MALKMALVRNIFSNLVRCKPNGPSIISPYRFVSTGINFPLFFRTSLPLLAEPLKKKKKIDPAILRIREEKKKRRIEKCIRKLEKNARELKPVEELQVPVNLTNEKTARSRKERLSQEEEENHSKLLKAWSQYKYEQHVKEAKMIDRITNSQQRALQQLKAISEELYFEAVQIDLQLVPFTVKGPTNTPSIENYEPHDGEIVDVSPKWQ